MFYNASPTIFERAKILRENMTLAEQKLWDNIRGKKIQNLRFLPQHPIDCFIVDFYCHSVKLVIKLDGGVHLATNQKEYDLGRTKELNNFGIKVVLFCK